MNINWDIVIKIAVPLGTLILGKYLDRWLYRRPKLISYLGHTSAFNVQSEPPINIHTHAIVLKNAGRATANQVRVGHHILPDNFLVYPQVPHSVERSQGTAAEIVIPRLVPGEQITISYLYFPPLIWNQINSYTKSDVGYAKILNVLPTPQRSKWASAILWTLIFIGTVSVIYAVIELIRKFV